MFSSKLAASIFLFSLAIGTIAVDPLDFLFSSNRGLYPQYHPMAGFNEQYNTEPVKRAPANCVCTQFLGCHGPGCLRKVHRFY